MSLRGENFRTRTVAGFFLLAWLIVVARFFYLQILSGDYWQSVAKSQHGGTLTLEALRGDIGLLDEKTGEVAPVATTIKKALVYANPKVIKKDTLETARVLANALNLEEKDLLVKISDTNKSYVILKKDLTDAETAKIRALKFSGIYLGEETARFYPQGEALASVLGFVGFKDGSDKRQGLYGLERAFDAELAGQDGRLEQDRASRTGAWIFGGRRDFQPAVNGESLVLNIDLPSQRKAEEVLGETLKAHGAERGCILAMEAKTGRILVMASLPGFDPNEYSKAPDLSVYNNVCLSAYEPGSVMKPLTMAAGIEDGKVSVDTEFEDPGQIKIDGFTIKNSDNKAHGKVNMTQVLEKSLNTGAIFVKDSIGNARFSTWLDKFGFGKATGIEVAESKGSLKNLREAVNVNFATASFGQGISTTPLQMLRAFGSLSNGGVMMQTKLVYSHILPNGQKKIAETSSGERVVSSHTAGQLSAMLISVVENGHGKKAKVAGYSVAGKTGTAQVVLPGEKGYDPHKTIGTFVGFAPAFSPRFVVLTRVDAPSTVQFAESTAAPAFAEVMRYLLERFNVPPDRVEKAR